MNRFSWMILAAIASSACGDCGSSDDGDVGPRRDAGVDADVSAADADVFIPDARVNDVAVDASADLAADLSTDLPIDSSADAARDVGDMSDADMGRNCVPVDNGPCGSDADCPASRCVGGFCEPRYDSCTLSESPFQIMCTPANAGAASFEWLVAAGTTSFVVTAFTPDGLLTPLRVEQPSGAVNDLQTAFDWQSTTALNEQWLNPVLMPPTTLFPSHISPGTYRYDVQTTGSEVCWYVANGVMGNQIRLVVHLVGVPGINASSAAQDPDLQATIAHAQAIYASVGLDLSVERYVDPAPDVVTLYRIVRDLQDVRALVATADIGTSNPDEALRIPVFIVETYMAGIGTSRGVPGPPGLMRSRASGVLLTSALLGTMPMGNFDPRIQDGNLVTGTILAHEVGHYLGLRHTTELAGEVDPLPDTPECSPPLDLNCPDLTNLMFPAAADNHVDLTPQQAGLIQLSPLAR